MWIRPEVGRRYVVGAAVDEVGCACVLDRADLSLCAQFYARVAPDIFAEEIARLAEIFNTALIACEDTGHGSTANRALRRLQYPKLYYRKELDDRGVTKTEKLGWLTNTSTLPILIDDLAALIREGWDCRSRETLDELMTVVVGDNGKVETKGSSRVLAAAIAVQIKNTSGLESIYPNLKRREHNGTNSKNDDPRLS
jgi:hypothetical protein